MIRRALVLICLVLFILNAGVAAAQSGDAMTNDQVVMMVKNRLTESVVLTAIDTAQATAFDVTPAGLVALRTGGVKDKVILAVQKAAAERQKGGAKAAMTNAEVIQMSSGKVRLSDPVITAAIQHATSTAFDVSPKGLIDLKTGKVSTSIIQLIQTKASSPVAAAPAPIPAPTPATAKPAPASTAKPPAPSTAKPSTAKPTTPVRN